MSDSAPVSDAPFSDLEGPGGDSPSSPGSLSPLGTGAATEESLGARIKAAREAKGLTRYKADKEAGLGPGTTKRIEEGIGTPSPDKVRRLGELLGLDLAPAVGSPPLAGPSEVRPRSKGPRKRGPIRRRLTRPAEAPGERPSRPTVRRVSTAPLTESLVAFAAGGLDRIGQRPLALYAGFTAPVAGEIVDDAIEGTIADKLVQPLVRGSEKYQNLSALVAGYAAVAWASNNPEAADSAYALFHWSMTVLLPIQGKQMVKRAKEQQKAAEALAEILPELEGMGLGPDPIRGLWSMMWAQPPVQAEPVAEEAVPA